MLTRFPKPEAEEAALRRPPSLLDLRIEWLLLLEEEEEEEATLSAVEVSSIAMVGIVVGAVVAGALSCEPRGCYGREGGVVGCGE